jgi:hypothetical protein
MLQKVAQIWELKSFLLLFYDFSRTLLISLHGVGYKHGLKVVAVTEAVTYSGSYGNNILKNC